MTTQIVLVPHLCVVSHMLYLLVECVYAHTGLFICKNLQTSRKLTFHPPPCLFNIFSAKCIDHYTKQCVENAELPEGEKKPVDERLEGIVNKMFQRCLDDHKYKQAIGIALETRRLDIFEKTILESVCARDRRCV